MKLPHFRDVHACDGVSVYEEALVIPEFERAVLTADLTSYGLQSGDVGTVVHVLGEGEGEAYIVKFFTLDGETINVVVLDAARVRPVGDNEIAHARPLPPAVAGD